VGHVNDIVSAKSTGFGLLAQVATQHSLRERLNCSWAALSIS
jgi:hypothetical protein